MTSSCGQPDFGGLAFTIGGTELPYGRFLNALIAFPIISWIVFAFVVRPMNQLMARFKRGADPDAPSAEVAMLTEIRNLLREQAR